MTRLRLAALALAGAITGGPAMALAAMDAPVVVTGRVLAPLLGERIGGLGLLAWRGGAWHPIPFQVDPRVFLERPGRATRLVHLLRASGEPDPVPARRLGPEDEIVFMREDAGSEPPLRSSAKRGPREVDPRSSAKRGPREVDPRSSARRGPREVDVTSHPPGARAGVLLRLAGGGVAGLFAFDGAPPLSPIRYVRYDEDSDRVQARTYTLGFSRTNALVFDTLRIRRPGDDAHSPAGLSPNLIDRIKVRVRGRILHAIPLARSEADFETHRDGVRAGPVRIVRGSRERLSMFLGLKSPPVEEEQIFFPDGFEFPIWFVKSGVMNRMATRLDVRAGPDWSSAAVGMRVRVEGQPVDARVDGRMEPEERRLTKEGPTWNLLHGPEGAILTKLVALSGPGGLPRVPVRTWYRDDRDARDPPEREPGTMGDIAFEFHDLARLKPGEYHWAVVTRVMPRYREGDERAALAAIESAPRVSVAPVAMPAEPPR